MSEFASLSYRLTRSNLDLTLQHAPEVLPETVEKTARRQVSESVPQTMTDPKRELTSDINGLKVECQLILTQLEKHKPLVDPPVIITQHELVGIIDDLADHFVTLKDIRTRNYRLYTLEEAEASTGPALTDLSNSLKKARTLAQTLKYEYEQEAIIRTATKKHKLPLPTFSGEFTAWQSFKDRFDASIDRDPSLTQAQKLEHLQSCMVKDSQAYNLINPFQITDGNYRLAYTELVNRYEKEREIFFAHFEKITDLPVLQNQGGLQLMIDTINQTLIKIKTMKIPVSELDPIMVFFVFKRLDFNSRREVEKQFSSSTIPKLKELLEFLLPLATSFQATRKELPDPNKQTQPTSSSSSSVPHQTSNNSRGTKSYKSHNNGKPQINTNSSVKCDICDMTNHLSYSCRKLIDLPIDQRPKLIKDLMLCPNCLRHHLPNPCGSQRRCQKCTGFHHTLLCKSNAGSSHSASFRPPLQPSAPNGPTTNLLATVLIDMYDSKGKLQRFRGLADTGSQFNFISERCASVLKIPRKKSTESMTGTGATPCGPLRGTVFVRAQSITNSKYKVEFPSFILQKVTVDHPQTAINDEVNWPHLSSIPLADPTFRQTGRVDFILGSGVYGLIEKSGLIKLQRHQPVARETELGWLVYGQISNSPLAGSSLSTHLCTESHPDPDFDLTKFWNQEEFPTLQPSNSYPETNQAEEHFLSTHKRSYSGRYVVQLPFNPEAKELGNSKRQAISRFLMKERTLLKTPNHYSAYQEEFSKLIEHGVLSKIPLSGIVKPDNRSYYLPHHAVIKDSSKTTKTRIVFDGSAATSTGISLNDTLFTGPTIQDELITILMRFRIHRIVFMTDIAKMFHQIAVDPIHHDFLRLIWRKYKSFPLEEYRFTRVPFGITCSSFLATRALRQLAHDEGMTFPLGSSVLLNDFYVDDCLTGTTDLTTALQTKDELIELSSKGGFHLTKWNSNSAEFLNSIPVEDRATDPNVEIGADSSVKTLGVRWNPRLDSFYFTTNNPNLILYTKQQVVSIIARLYDPIGWLQPIVVPAKFIIQDIWNSKIDWRHEIPKSIDSKWRAYLEDLPQIEQIQIPRRYYNDGVNEIQLHGFSDASQKAYGAVIYVRASHDDGSITTRIVAAKSRITPKKMMENSPNPDQSIPRLELMGALLCSQLMDIVRTSLKIAVEEIHYWTDSSITLWRLHNPKLKNDSFVKTRIEKILALSPFNLWHYVKTSENPADFLSRGLTASQLTSNSLWWDGPIWISASIVPFGPIPGSPEEHGLKEEKSMSISAHVTTTFQLDLNQHKRTYHGLLRATSLIHRGIRALKANTNDLLLPNKGPITPAEFCIAEETWIRKIQLHSFPEETDRLTKGKPIRTTSRILKLAPFLDPKGILRVGGRIQKSEMPEDFKHQVILPNNNAFTIMLLRSYHTRLLHTGIQQVRYAVVEKFWVLHAREAVRKLINHCVTCFRFSAKPCKQLMGNLPKARVTPDPMFVSTGVDFAGPIPIKLSAFRATRGRPESNGKAYIALFICMWSKAIHLELVTGLTTELFMAAFTRFLSKWGPVSHMYSDNGTNFIGADNEIKAFQDFIQSTQTNNPIASSLSQKQISWHLNPPAAPHHGGLWEAGVKSVKHHLKRVVGDRVLNYEELSTLLAQIEAVLNSRPLYPLESNQKDHYPLTPAHFYLRRPLTAMIRPDVSHLPTNRMSTYEEIQQMAQTFRERWSREYLAELQERSKWNSIKPNLVVGQWVLLADDLKPNLKWETGKITRVHPGEDGLVRKVTVDTDRGTYIRPIVNIIPYPPAPASVHP